MPYMLHFLQYNCAAAGEIQLQGVVEGLVAVGAAAFDAEVVFAGLYAAETVETVLVRAQHAGELSRRGGESVIREGFSRIEIKCKDTVFPAENQYFLLLVCCKQNWGLR